MKDNYRQRTVMRAMQHLDRALDALNRAEQDGGWVFDAPGPMHWRASKCHATADVKYAISDLRNALDIAPSEAAIEEVVAAQKEQAA